ncbi:MAG: hypothetical protein ABIC95_02675 [archaeon]
MLLSFFPTEVSKRQIEGREVVFIYGRSDQGKKVCVLDRKFHPSFYVLPKAPENVENLLAWCQSRIVQTDIGGVKAMACGLVLKKLLGADVVAIRVVTKNLMEESALAKAFSQNPQIQGLAEHDLDFLARYTLARSITPFKLMPVEGNYINFRSKVTVFEAETFGEVGTEQLKTPSLLSFMVELETGKKTEEIRGCVHPALEIVPVEERRFTSAESLIRDILIFDGNTFASCRQIALSQAQEGVEQSARDAERDTIRCFGQMASDIKPDFLLGFDSHIRDLSIIARRAEGLGIKLSIGLDHSGVLINRHIEQTARIRGMGHIAATQIVNLLVGATPYSIEEALTFISDKRSRVAASGFPAWLKETTTPHDGETLIKRLHALGLLTINNLVELSVITKIFPNHLLTNSLTRNIDHFIASQQDTDALVPGRHTGTSTAMTPAKPLNWADIIFHDEELPDSALAGIVRKGYCMRPRHLQAALIAKENISFETVRCDCCRNGRSDEELWICENTRGTIASLVGSLISRRARIVEMLRAMKESPLLEARLFALDHVLDFLPGYVANDRAKFKVPEATALIRKRTSDILETATLKMTHRGATIKTADNEHIIATMDRGGRTDLDESLVDTLPEGANWKIEGPFPNMIYFLRDPDGNRPRLAFVAISEESMMIERWDNRMRSIRLPLLQRLTTQMLTMAISVKDKSDIKAHLDSIVDFGKDMMMALRDGRIDREAAILLARLRKDLDEYENALFHVEAARRLVGQGYEVIRGMIIPYIVGAGLGHTRERVQTYFEPVDEGLDTEYYLTTYLFPMLEEIFEPLGIDMGEMAGESQLPLDAFLKRRRKKSHR